MAPVKAKIITTGLALATAALLIAGLLSWLNLVSRWRPADDAERIQGDWTILVMSDGGRVLPTPGRCVLDGQTIEFHFSNKVERFSYAVDSTNEPGHFDIVHTPGRLMPGICIYAIEGDKICVNEQSGGERATAFESERGTPNDLLLVLERD